MRRLYPEGCFVVFAASVTATGILRLIGNSVATVVVSKLRGEFDESMQRDAYARQDTGYDLLEPARVAKVKIARLEQY